MVMCDETIEYLAHYKGRESFDRTKHAALLQHLQDYGWVLSLRLWSHEEILLMCIIIMDPSLQFDSIRQKDKGNSGENKQNRGMALCLGSVTKI